MENSLSGADLEADASPSGPDDSGVRVPNDELYQAHLKVIVESSCDAIIAHDLGAVVSAWNSAATRLYGYTAAEMQATPFSRLIPASHQALDTQILEALLRGETFPTLETLRCHKDGRPIAVSVTAAAIRDRSGHVVGISRIERPSTVTEGERRQQSERRFSDTMIDSMPGVVYFYDSSGRFLRWNRMFETESGYSGSEIAGMHPLDFFPAESQSLLTTRIGEVFVNGVSSVEAPLQRKTGETIPYYFTGHRVEFDGRDCLVGVGVNITDRKLAEARLQESEFKLRALFEQAPMGIAIVNSETGEFLKVNPAYCAIAGYAEEEMLRLRYQDISFPEDLPQDLEQMRLLLSGEIRTFHMEKRLVRRTGDVLWISLTVVQLENALQAGRQHIAMIEDITQRKCAEDLRRESERKYRELVELANSIILRWNSDGRITFLNEFGQQFFGYTAEEIVGRHVVGTIVPESAMAGTDLRDLMARICENPSAYERNVNENIRRNGERRLVAWTNRILQGESGDAIEILSVGSDITERHEAEEARRQSEGRYRTLFDCAPDGIVIANSEGYYVDVNESMCQMLGYSRSEFVGLHSSEIVVPEEHSRIAEAIEEIGAHEEHHREWTFRRKDGSKMPAEVIGTAMPDGLILGMVRDITDRKQAEYALRELNETLEHRVVERTEDLRKALVQAEAADRLKSAFLATMSHELRTPLNSILGFAGILLQGLAGPLNAEQEKQLGMVRNSARHLLNLINDVLDISKIEAGQFEVLCEPFDVTRSLTRVLETISPLAAKKGLPVESEIAPDLGVIHGDERRFEQILLNLLSNAVKFTEHGAVRLSASHRERADGERQLVVAVSDTGIGIRKEEFCNLFQPFRQIDSGLSRSFDGTGLGLTICRKLAELMGGEVYMESEFGVGSTFTVALPVSHGAQP